MGGCRDFICRPSHGSQTFALGFGTILAGGVRAAEPSAAASLMGAGARVLPGLVDRLAKAPRRRDFKTVPMILDDSSQWDAEALKEIMNYEEPVKQVWDNTVLDSRWLNLMRNSLNAQIWSFKHPDFLAVSATHGSAHLALYDDTIWDKYQITELAGEKFKTNTLMVAKSAPSGAANYEAPGRHLLRPRQFDTNADAARRRFPGLSQRDLGGGGGADRERDEPGRAFSGSVGGGHDQSPRRRRRVDARRGSDAPRIAEGRILLCEIGARGRACPGGLAPALLAFSRFSG
jgi:hypothetical protein